MTYVYVMLSGGVECLLLICCFVIPHLFLPLNMYVSIKNFKQYRYVQFVFQHDFYIQLEHRKQILWTYLIKFFLNSLVIKERNHIYESSDRKRLSRLSLFYCDGPLYFKMAKLLFVEFKCC